MRGLRVVGRVVSGYFFAGETDSARLLFRPAVYKVIYRRFSVNARIYNPMNFRDATDQLTDCPSHDDIATAAGASVQSIRQARMDPDSPAYRTPPPNWREAVIRLAEERIERLRQLIEGLRG